MFWGPSMRRPATTEPPWARHRVSKRGCAAAVDRQGRALLARARGGRRRAKPGHTRVGFTGSVAGSCDLPLASITRWLGVWRLFQPQDFHGGRRQ